MYLISNRATIKVMYAIALRHLKLNMPHGEIMVGPDTPFVTFAQPGLRAEREGLIRLASNDTDGLPNFSRRATARPEYYFADAKGDEYAAFGIRALTETEQRSGAPIKSLAP